MPDTYRSTLRESLRDNIVAPFFVGAGYDQHQPNDREERADALAGTVLDSCWLEVLIAAAEQRGRRAEQARLSAKVDTVIEDLDHHREFEGEAAEFRSREGWVDVGEVVTGLLPDEPDHGTFTDASRLPDDVGVIAAIRRRTGLSASDARNVLVAVAEHIAARAIRNDAGPVT